MGFIRANIIPILKEHQRMPIRGKVLCLGAPDFYYTFEDLCYLANVAGISINECVEVTSSKNPSLPNCISGQTFFKALGIDDLFVLDYSPYEGADYLHDLNDPNLPENLIDQFDVIIDHGTLEHIFHIPNVLTNLFHMLHVGGRLIHCLPASNQVDHGFYSFSPTFFCDFYAANQWQINRVILVRFNADYSISKPCSYLEYQPGIMDTLSMGGLDDAIYSIISIVTKTHQSTASIIPSQYLYKNSLWTNSKSGQGEPSYQLPSPRFIADNFDPLEIQTTLDGVLPDKQKELEAVLENCHARIAAQQQELDELINTISSMKTSKFWKLRNLWFRLKSRIHGKS